MIIEIFFDGVFEKDIYKDFGEKDLKEIFSIILNNLGKNKGNEKINLFFVSDEKIKNLNNEFRGKNKSTDCLSFTYDEDFGVNENKIFGEIFIAFPYIQKQAENYKNSLKDEVFKMFVHSVLHLFGYDHISEKDFEIMNKKEQEIFAKIG